MSNLIQIKRSLITATATGLSNGELAYTANGDVLFIGSNSTVVAIGGARNPGTLTANQALVANATSGIDKVIVANAVITSLYANGSHGTVGQVLVSNGSTVYWGTGTSGSNTQIQFNDSGVANATAAFTFDKATNTLFVSNAVTVGSNVLIDTGSISVGNSTVNSFANSTVFNLNTSGTSSIKVGNSTVNTIINSSSISTGTISGTFNVSPVVTVSLSGDVTGSASATLTNLANGTVSITTTIQPDSVALGTDTTGNYVATITAGAGISGSVSSEGSTPTIAVVANNGLVSNSSGVFALANSGIVSNSTGLFANVDGSTLELSSGHIQVKDNGIALGTKTTGNYVATITASNGVSGNTSSEGENASIFVNPGNGIAANATGVHVVAGTGVTSNATGVHIGQAVGTTDNVTFNDVTINGNTTLGSGTFDVIAFNGVVSSNIFPSANITHYLGNNTLRWLEVHAQNVHSEYLYIDKDVTIGGNLTVSGNLVTVNVSTLSVTDSLIQLASNNTVSDSLDIGFFGSYNVGGGDHEHTGLFRDASDDKYKLFKGLVPSPTSVVDTSNNTYTIATLQAYLDSAGLVSNGTNVTITANSTLAVSITANSISLTTPLPGTSGGTGLNTYTVEDILVANSSNGFRKLGLGSDGYVLQSNGTAVVYSTLDGGTF